MEKDQSKFAKTALLATLALGVCLSPVCGATAQEIDVTPRRMAWIPPGAVVEKKSPPPGFSHVVYVAYPRLGAGDVDKVSDMVRRIAQQFSLAVAANVTSVQSGNQTVYRLDKVALGLGTKTRGRNVIITSDTQAELGAGLGFIDAQVLKQSEGDINQGNTQLARTPTMLVYDANTQLLIKGEHRRVLTRYVVLVSPQTGQLGALAWLLEPAEGPSHRLVDRPMQYLAPGTEVDRVLNVKADKFWLGIPSSDAFAQVSPMEGTPVDWNDRLRALAALRQYTPEQARQLEAELWKLWNNS